jgi:hypothetical protein
LIEAFVLNCLRLQIATSNISIRHRLKSASLFSSGTEVRPLGLKPRTDLVGVTRR